MKICQPQTDIKSKIISKNPKILQARLGFMGFSNNILLKWLVNSYFLKFLLVILSSYKERKTNKVRKYIFVDNNVLVFN